MMKTIGIQSWITAVCAASQMSFQVFVSSIGSQEEGERPGDWQSWSRGGFLSTMAYWSFDMFRMKWMFSNNIKKYISKLRKCYV